MKRVESGFGPEEDRRQENWITFTEQGIHGPGGVLGDPNKERKPTYLAILLYWLIPELGRPGCRCTSKRCHTWHLHWLRVHPWVQMQHILAEVASAITKEIDEEILASIIRKDQENGEPQMLNNLAPWTAEQVETLRMRQADRRLHPYTCISGCGNLTPTCAGWVCEICGWGQNWCFAVDMEKVLCAQG